MLQHIYNNYHCAYRGFQSSTTADLMMKRMHRQKKLQSNVIKRQKMNGNLQNFMHAQ